MKCFRSIFVCLCTLAIFAIASGCATDLSDDGLGGAEGGLDYSIDAAESSDIVSDDEDEELIALEPVTKPAGTCVCNPAPDSTGRYVFESETCSLCDNSADCATASCIYKHRAHNGLKEVGCQFQTNADAIDELGRYHRLDADEVDATESIEAREGLIVPDTVEGDESDEGLTSQDDGSFGGIGPKPEPCVCNAPPDSSGKWGNPVETCSKCETSADCASATCQYTHRVHGGLSDNVGCNFSSKIKRKLKKWKKKLESSSLIEF